MNLIKRFIKFLYQKFNFDSFLAILVFGTLIIRDFFRGKQPPQLDDFVLGFIGIWCLIQKYHRNYTTISIPEKEDLNFTIKKI